MKKIDHSFLNMVVNKDTGEQTQVVVTLTNPNKEDKNPYHVNIKNKASGENVIVDGVFWESSTGKSLKNKIDSLYNQIKSKLATLNTQNNNTDNNENANTTNNNETQANESTQDLVMKSIFGSDYNVVTEDESITMKSIIDDLDLLFE